MNGKHCVQVPQTRRGNNLWGELLRHIVQNKQSTYDSSTKFVLNINNDDMDRSSKRNLSNGLKSMTWSTYATIFILILVFHQISDPFRRKVLHLDNDSPKQNSLAYFYVNAFLYIWLVGSVVLTVVPKFSDGYNEIIATALFFPILGLTLLVLLFGRFTVRLAHLFLLLRYRENDDDTSSNGSEPWNLSSLWGLPKMLPFYCPIGKLFRNVLIVTFFVCVIYADCWSSNLERFEISSSDGLCVTVFTPFHLFEPQGKIGEDAIYIVWFASIIVSILLYIQDEYSGRHYLYRKQFDGFFNRQNRAVPSAVGVSMICNPPNELTPTYDHDSDSDDESIAWVDDQVDIRGGKDTIGNVFMHRFRDSFKTFARAKKENVERPKDTLPMVPWYTVLLLETAFKVMVEIVVFVGRFDARSLSPALREEGQSLQSPVRSTDDSPSPDYLFSQLKGVLFDLRENVDDDGGIWFDFMADCGDGFNPSYNVARTLAQPHIDVSMGSSSFPKVLPRGKILLIGGDLCYPGPNEFNFEKRFFRVFEDAMPPPPWFRRSAISLSKPSFPIGGWDTSFCYKDKNNRQMNTYLGPSCFTVPGNHDYYDGLASYTRYILNRDWLGGWLLPQEKSYFALALPNGFWLFGLDYGLSLDIDLDQFKFFCFITKKLVKDNDSIILINHEPAWILEADGEGRGPEFERNVRELIDHHLRGRLRLRMAGDLHHYTRHTPVNAGARKKAKHSTNKAVSDLNEKEDTSTIEPPELIVSGGGGAFMHGTHTFKETIKVKNTRLDSKGDQYVRVCSYPSAKTSSRLALLNIYQFRWRNWRCDILWGFVYFCIVSSLFPVCGVYADYLEAKTENPIDSVKWAFHKMFSLFCAIFQTGRISLFVTILTLSLTYVVTDSNMKPAVRIVWGAGHGLIHCFAAIACLLFIQCLIEYALVHHMVSVNLPEPAQLIDTFNLKNVLYEEYIKHFSGLFWDYNFTASDVLPTGAKDYFTGIRSFDNESLLRATFSLFDLPSTIAQKHSSICTTLYEANSPMIYGGPVSMVDRSTLGLYLISIGLYFTVLAVPVAGLIFGSWLALTLNLLHRQTDAGFCSLRIQHWKNFTRLHITPDGNLEIYGIGLDRVPKHWYQDEQWDGNEDSVMKRKDAPSWTWKNPSRWKSDKTSTKFSPRIIDYTVISRKTTCKSEEDVNNK